MSAHKKVRLVVSHAEANSTQFDTRQPDGGMPVKDKAISLKERARLMLDLSDAQSVLDEADIDKSQATISQLYRTLNDQSIRTSQMCMDAELRAIAAIEERVTTELRLVEADYECITMEMRARKALADKLQEAEKAVAAARSKEHAALNEIDLAKSVNETEDNRILLELTEKRKSVEIRALKLQKIRMDAEQCAIQEIELLVADDDPMSNNMPCNQNLSEESILQMALENGMLATQIHSDSAQSNSSKQNIDVEAEANRLLNNLRNTNWRSLLMESPTLH